MGANSACSPATSEGVRSQPLKTAPVSSPSAWATTEGKAALRKKLATMEVSAAQKETDLVAQIQSLEQELSEVGSLQRDIGAKADKAQARNVALEGELQACRAEIAENIKVHKRKLL